jgi:hypothetical protein
VGSGGKKRGRIPFRIDYDVLNRERLTELLRSRKDFSVREIVYEILRREAFGKANIHFILTMTDEALYSGIDALEKLE